MLHYYNETDDIILLNNKADEIRVRKNIDLSIDSP